MKLAYTKIMTYKALKDGIIPDSGREIKKGQIIDLFHQYGDTLTKGDDPLLRRTKRPDPHTALALKETIKRELGVDAFQPRIAKAPEQLKTDSNE